MMLAIAVAVPGGSSWLTSGEYATDVRVDLAGLTTSGRSRERPITGRTHHRRFVAAGGVAIEDFERGWRLRLVATARGRGVLRPLTGVLGIMFGWLVRRELTGVFDEWEASGTPLIELLTQPGDPNEVATAWLVDLLAPYVDEPGV